MTCAMCQERDIHGTEHDVTTASRKVLAPVSGLLEMNTVQQKSE